MTKGRDSKLQREPVIEKRLPDANPPVCLVRGARIRFAPGQPTGIHCHPISTCGVVTKGNFIFQVEGEAEQRLKTGDAFSSRRARPSGASTTHQTVSFRRSYASIWRIERKLPSSRC